MIVKKIPARPSGRDQHTERSAHVRQLVDYLNQPDKRSLYREYLVRYLQEEGLGASAERLLHVGARNLLSVDMHGQRAEMMATAQAATRSPNPLDHWLLSWRAGEHPTAEQVDAVVDMFVAELGLSAHQAIFALHGDTHNRHVHIAVNRYNPHTGRVVTIERGFYLEAAHRAVARIVDHFGWQPEEKARYRVVDGRVFLSEDATRRMQQGERALLTGACAVEVRTGLRSAQRIAQEEAWPIIQTASSWSALHAGLAAAGFVFDPIGTNGAKLILNGQGVAASHVHRDATITRLQRRLGPFQPRAVHVQITPRNHDVDALPHGFRALDYRAACAQSLVGRHRDGGAAPNETRRRPQGLEEWLLDQGEEWFARRFRNPSLPPMPATRLTGVRRAHVVLPTEIDGFHAYPERPGITRWARPGEPTAFVDTGDFIAVLPRRGDETVLAALRLAIIKTGGRVRVNGPTVFQNQVYRLAVAHGLAGYLTNPDMVARETARRQAEARASAQRLPDRSSSMEPRVAVALPADRVPPVVVPPPSATSLTDRVIVVPESARSAENADATHAAQPAGTKGADRPEAPGAIQEPRRVARPKPPLEKQHPPQPAVAKAESAARKVAPPPATSTSNERSNREAIASPPPTGKAKPSVDQSASSRAAARGRVYERLGKMRRAPRSPLRLAFEQCLAETLGEGHKFDRRLLDAARPVLTAEPPLIEVGRSRAQDPTKKWSARPKPGAPAGVTRVIAELRETESGRAFLDRFLPHLEKLSPRSDEAVEVMVAESVMSRRENVTPVTLSEPRPVEPGEDGDAVQRAWAERQKKTR
jgi:hypothetical protein